MDLNRAIQRLNMSDEPWISYTQLIDLFNPYNDSSYNNHVFFTENEVEIVIPSQIDMIYNLRIYSSSHTDEKIELFLYSNKSCRKINSNFLFNEEGQPIHIKCKRPTGQHFISFTTVIFKKNVRSKLRAKL